MSSRSRNTRRVRGWRLLCENGDSRNQRFPSKIRTGFLMLNVDLSNPYLELSPQQVADLLGRDVKTVRRLMKTDDEAVPGDIYIRSWVDHLSTTGKKFLRTSVQHVQEFREKRMEPRTNLHRGNRRHRQAGQQRHIPKSLNEIFGR